jgi:hypothetical protein
LVPDPLIAACAHDPLAVGVYVAIARLAMVAKGAVPLAAWDLVVWMGSERESDRAAIMRRIVKLEQEGWVIIARASAAKHRLLPTWGRDQMGQVRSWRFDDANRGRPSHLRGRRVPLALLDTYLGRLDPLPGPGRALISRYITRPLLDLTDIGVYTIGLRAEVAPTPRLRHLGLHDDTGMRLPLDNHAVLLGAAAGTMTTLDGDRVILVQLSAQGQARLGLTPSAAAGSTTPQREDTDGSVHGSIGGSGDGSAQQPDAVRFSERQDDDNAVSEHVTPLITWDVGILQESINRDSTPQRRVTAGGGAADLDGLPQRGVTQRTSSVILTTDDPQQTMFLNGRVIEGHRMLNAIRRIPPGEWLELRDLQEAHGAERLLIWQARAARAATEHPHGITPAYYHACATKTAVDIDHSARVDGAPTPRTREPERAPTALEPACDSLLRAMGVRERQKLAGAPYDLIVAWQGALEHQGLAAQFASPIGFAVSQMQRGQAPPTVVELDRWSERARRSTDRYETWRHAESPAIGDTVLTSEQQLEARVRGLAPPDADLAELCTLARWLEAGATDMDAVEMLYAERAGGRR